RRRPQNGPHGQLLLCNEDALAPFAAHRNILRPAWPAIAGSPSRNSVRWAATWIRPRRPSAFRPRSASSELMLFLHSAHHRAATAGERFLERSGVTDALW